MVVTRIRRVQASARRPRDFGGLAEALGKDRF